MRWQLLDRIDVLVPGSHTEATSTTDFPSELYADHFPSFPVTPGVLLTEMGAQLSGLLTQASVLQSRGRWVFPFLGMIERAKFRAFVPPGTRVVVRATLDELRPNAAICKAELRFDQTRCANMTLMLPFDPDGAAGQADPERLRAHSIQQLRRLEAPWLPTLL